MQLSSIQTKNNSYNQIMMFFLIIGAVLLFFLILGDIAYASDATSGGGASLPWEAPLEKLKKSVSGPVAFVVSLLGLVAGGATLIFGGEVSEFVKRIIYLVLVISVIVFANTLLTGALFSGAVIPANAMVGRL
ncbi:TrbC/VirB2 family protein [Bartonella harrusi]|uniref:TrbC/VirB2 family protein n=1 Tax=Bartonella harrusi TaxID=2961895 RepID=A0ABY5EU45_9HYPH|nr:TrbC/VirB2 family protein [Bartonella harrusi]UTO27656.1 TrbC/VirB2 family protein [Bartonella harrusi]